jgi:hypothetical protein
MLISKKQQEANRQNAQHSTGPVTPEGKARVSINAFTYGLRTHQTIVHALAEDATEYLRLWDDFDIEWKPQGRTELCYLEAMVSAQWLLARAARGEKHVYDTTGFGVQSLAMLTMIYKIREKLERSFRAAVEDMKKSQKERQSRTQIQSEQAAAKAAAVPATPPATPPAYVMSDATEAHPVSCAPNTTDTR